MKRYLRPALLVAFLAGGVLMLLSCTSSMGATRGTGLFDSKPVAGGTQKAVSNDDISFDDEENFSLDDEPVKPATASSRKQSSVDTSDDLRKLDYDKREASSVSSDSDAEVDAQYDQKGLASWYGREFHGRKTASGTKFDMYEMTAAHRTLPFGTVLKVTNLETGKSIKVRVNDRGPYKNTRIIDLSYASARELGFLAKGETMVGINILSLGDGKVTKSSNNDIKGVSGADDLLSDDPVQVEPRTVERGNFELQAGAFYSLKNAEKMKAKIESITQGEVSIVEEGDLYKIRLINIGSKSEAESMMRQLDAENIKSMLLQKK